MLTNEEKRFCELYQNGIAPYAGNPSKCYAEAFNVEEDNNANLNAIALLNERYIQEYIESLPGDYEQSKYIKKFLTTNLMHIIEESSNSTFINRKGELQSPAPLRAVAVTASKALMELYPVKDNTAQEVNLNTGPSGVVFNVIVPGKENKDKEEK